MSRFTFTRTPISGLVVVERQRLGDHRGFLSRLFCAEAFREAGVALLIAQINQTLTHELGSVRGLHFQHAPYCEDKVVTCIRGEIFDVAVDLRRGSETFLEWYGVILSEENSLSLLIPQGFAHGFQTLSDDCELVYLHSTPYVPAAEGAVNACDPTLAVHWPLPITEMSDRDRGHPYLSEEFAGITP